MKLYTEYEIVGFLTMHYKDEICAKTFMENLTPVQLPIDEEIESLTYDDGYKEGYKRALDYIKDTIKNKIEIKENGSNSTSVGISLGTMSTTNLCTVFVPNEFVFKNRCKKCGKEANQHPIITPTI